MLSGTSEKLAARKGAPLPTLLAHFVNTAHSPAFSERDRVAHVEEARDVGERALEAQPEARVRTVL
jgi:hypothetical protein